MFPTDQATAASSLPTPAAAGTSGYFTNGNPATGVAATIVDADWLNMIQQELLNIVAAGGLTPSKTTYNQVLAAIKRVIQNTTILADTGTANAYSAVNTVPLVSGATPTWIDGVVQAVKIAHANTGASTYAPDGLTAIPIYGLGLQPLQGSELVVGGTAILMRTTISSVNSGNPICILMECAGGAQQVPPATASQHAPQMAQVAGVVGSVRNLAMSVTAASASAPLTADEIIVETAFGGVRYCLPSFSKTINLATTGAGGMDTGTAPVSGYVAIYAIYNPTTGTAALLATNATSAAAPNVYGGANMPSGYTASALVSVWPTNASSLLVAGVQYDRSVSLTNVQALQTSTQVSSLTALSISSCVPKNAKNISGTAVIGSTSASTNVTNIAGSSTGIGLIVISNGSSASSSTQGPYSKVALITPQTIYYSATASAGTMNYTLNITGYDF